VSIADDIHLAGPERLEFVVRQAAPITNYKLAVYGSAMTAGTSFTYVDPRVGERRAVAVAFARLARYIDGVREIWLRDTTPDLEVAVIVSNLDLPRELTLRGVFIDLACDMLDASEGELRVFAESEGVPDWLRDGERLV
jgi:hypothetical protein